MSGHESHLQEAERHIGEFEERIARQEARIEELERGNHHDAAKRARELLATFHETLRVGREHRRIILEEQEQREG
jgi:hypothetical protein